MAQGPMLLALLLVCATASGCFYQRTSLDAQILNRTDATHTLELTIRSADGGSDRPVYTELMEVPPNATGTDAIRLDDVVTDAGSYRVEAVVDEDERASRQIDWSRETGPDIVSVEIDDDGVEIDVLIV